MPDLGCRATERKHLIGISGSGSAFVLQMSGFATIYCEICVQFVAYLPVCFLVSVAEFSFAVICKCR